MVATLIPERRDSSAILISELSADFGIAPLLAMEKGLLTTFGRVMPVGMTVATALAIIIAINDPNAWLTSAAVSLGLALTVTIIGNVPINARTGRISADTAPAGFIAMRRRWDAFQIVRASLQLLGFVLVTIGVLG